MIVAIFGAKFVKISLDVGQNILEPEFAAFQLFATFRSHVFIFISLFSKRSSKPDYEKSHINA